MKGLVLTCKYGIALSAVWDAWTDIDQLEHWWGNDIKHPLHAGYESIVNNQELRFKTNIYDSHGNTVAEIDHAITFIQEDGKTKLVISANVGNLKDGAKEYLGKLQAGWTERLERLGYLLAEE